MRVRAPSLSLLPSPLPLKAAGPRGGCGQRGGGGFLGAGASPLPGLVGLQPSPSQLSLKDVKMALVCSTSVNCFAAGKLLGMSGGWFNYSRSAEI